MHSFQHGEVHYVQEDTLPELIEYPVLPHGSWDAATTELEQTLASHGEEPRQGDRFLIGRMTRLMRLEGHRKESPVQYEYILALNENDQYERWVEVYSTASSLGYDFEVFEMLPVSDSMGLQYLA